MALLLWLGLALLVGAAAPAQAAPTRPAARGAGKAAAAKPKAGKAGTAKAGTARAAAGKAGAAKAGATKPGAAKAGAVKAGAGKASAGKAGAVKAGAGKAGAAKAGAAKADAAKSGAADSAKQRQQDAAMRKRCASKKQAKSAACKAFAAAERDRAADAQLAKRCSTAKGRKTASCKKFLAKKAGGRDACGRKYVRAKKGDTVARLAKRHGLSEAALRKLNDLPDKTKKLRSGGRYLVAKSPHDGVTLSGGVQLTEDSGALKLRRPHLAFGKPMLVSVIEASATAVQASSPLGVPLMVGDLSRDGGGCLPPHKSHRGGLDADIGFYFRGAFAPQVLADAAADTIDADRTWQFLRGLLATGRLQYAFIHYDLQPALYEAALRAGETPESAARLIQYPRPIEQARDTPIRHLDGHDDHMHVRFACADEACQLSDDEKAAIAALRLESLGGPARERRGRGLDSPLRRGLGAAAPLR